MQNFEDFVEMAVASLVLGACVWFFVFIKLTMVSKVDLSANQIYPEESSSDFNYSLD